MILTLSMKQYESMTMSKTHPIIGHDSPYGLQIHTVVEGYHLTISERMRCIGQEQTIRLNASGHAIDSPQVIEQIRFYFLLTIF